MTIPFDQSIIGSLQIKPQLQCDCCEVVSPEVKRTRQNTLYDFEGEAGSADDPNYATLCPPCQNEADEYWKSMWDDYWAGRL